MICDLYRYTEETVNETKLIKVNKNIKKSCQNWVETTYSFNIKVNLSWINYKVSKINLEIFLII